ncbi:unnamed protein product [Urochloa humidicola]
MASPSPSPSLPRQLLRYMSGALHRFSPLPVHPKPFAVSVSVAAAVAATLGFYQGRGKHSNGIVADGAATAASVQRGVKAAATNQPAAAGTPIQGKGKDGGVVHPPPPGPAGGHHQRN